LLDNQIEQARDVFMVCSVVVNARAGQRSSEGSATSIGSGAREFNHRGREMA
jgi:hypothetical protein